MRLNHPSLSGVASPRGGAVVDRREVKADTSAGIHVSLAKQRTCSPEHLHGDRFQRLPCLQRVTARDTHVQFSTSKQLDRIVGRLGVSHLSQAPSLQVSAT